MKHVNLLGATGSIGTSTLEVIAAYPELFNLTAFSFHQNIASAREIIRGFQPQLVACGFERDAQVLAGEFPKVQFTYGLAGLIDVAVFSEGDITLNSVVGSIGLEPTLAAINAGLPVALANKETLVMGGELVMTALKRQQGTILPVDSEHSAIFQCLCGQEKAWVDHLLITASGGSFRDLSREELKNVTVKDALKHPNWSMGAKITIDSSTMVNKGLEVIEAKWLFDMNYDKIKVVLHRESLVHSMIVLRDGAYLAQLGASDMREPIQYALTYPERLPIKSAKPFDLKAVGELHFAELSLERFPLLALAYEVGRAGGSYPSVYNAANEVAVTSFLAGEIPYLGIEEVIQRCTDHHHSVPVKDIQQLLAVDQHTRVEAKEFIKKMI